jgi:hypothetical protein
VVNIVLGVGQVKNYADNAYDPALPFPLDGKFRDILAFGRKLTSQGIPCLVGSFSSVENVNEASSTAPNTRVHPSDPRAFMMQYIPRLVSLAQFAESMGCEYFSLFGDDTEPLVVDSSVTDLWVQAITQVRAVFSGRVISGSAWGLAFDHQPQIISMLDALGIGLLIIPTGHPDPTVAELVAAYQQNAQGVNHLKALTSVRTLYQKPILITDNAFASFKGSNTLGEGVLFDLFPAGQFTVDYQEQVNEYQAFFQAMSTLNPNWMLGWVAKSFDRLPLAWEDANQPYLSSLGVSLRGKPALQTLTQAYLDFVVGGWQLSGQYTIQSGAPVTFDTSDSFFFSGRDFSFARGKRTLSQWFDTSQFYRFPDKGMNQATLTTYPWWSGVQSMPGCNYVPASSDSIKNGVYQDFGTFGPFRRRGPMSAPAA